MTDPGTSYQIPFPDLELPDLDGALHRLSAAWAAGPVLLVFGHSGCDTTRYTLPRLERIQVRRREGTVLAILQDAPEDARALVAAAGLTFPVRLEAAPWPLAAAVGLASVPTLFMVEPDGRAERSIAFVRADIERFARRLGVEGPLFAPGEKVAALRPG